MLTEDKFILNQMQTLVDIQVEHFQSDFEADKIKLKEYDFLPHFVWITRKNGTGLCVIGEDSMQKHYFSSLHSMTEHPSYYHYDGKKLQQITKREACKLLNIKIEKQLWKSH